MKKKIIICVEIILVLLLFIEFKKVSKYRSENISTEKIYEETKDIIAVNTGDGSEDSNIGTFNKLIENYPDIVGFIDIKNTRISYPIVQAMDNEYYLEHSPDKTYNQNGSIFLDYRNDGVFQDDNNIVYGHYIKSGKLFFDLQKFKEQEFYDNNKTIELYTEEGIRLYDIYSVYVEDPEYDYRQTDYKNLDEKINFIGESKEKSIVKVGEIDYDQNSKLLTLSTCSDRGKLRLVVHAIERK